jgi:hypothetical protein
VGAYKAAVYLSHDLGFAGLPALAAERMRRVAEELDDPVWIAYAAYQRAQLISGTNRPRQYQLAVTAAETTASRVEIRGMANLTAALAELAWRGRAPGVDHGLRGGLGHMRSAGVGVEDAAG